MFVGDRDRDRAAVALREHYARGRLTLEELSDRTASVFGARSQSDLRNALSGLPGSLFLAIDGDVRERGRSVAQAVARGAALVLFTGAYLVFSFALLFVFALTALFHGVSSEAMVVFLAAWLVPTYLLVRLWHRRPARHRAGI